MIVFRVLNSREVMSMIKDESFDKLPSFGKNTFHYEEGCQYKHFFYFAEHAKSYVGGMRGKIIGMYIIPNDIICEFGYGFYNGIKTMRNNNLAKWDMPLPEIIIKNEDFKKDYLYEVTVDIQCNHIRKSLTCDGNIGYDEPLENYFRGDPTGEEKLDYSYADIYYEMVNKIALENNMDPNKVVEVLKTMDLHKEIENFYKDNIDYLFNKTDEYLKTKEKNKAKIKTKLKSLFS